MSNPTTRNLVIGGAAGQGLGSAGHLLARHLVRLGHQVLVTQSYQSRIRGGHNSIALRVSQRTLSAPQERIDLLLALDQETIALHAGDLAPEGRILAAGSPSLPDELRSRTLRVPISDLGGKPLTNFILLGVAASCLGLEASALASAAQAALQKRPELAQKAAGAVRAAQAWANEQAGVRDGMGSVRLPAGTEQGQTRRVLMSGNQAIALGAISAGIRFCAFYPMTPATSVNQTLVSLSERCGLVVEQAEDEIAAINMAIGASFAGAPALVATSGGGFALMTEGVSLAAMTETPLVVVVAQRPGPATGLPTRTEQADLEFVLHAGHGEFPRAVFAPGSVEACFHLTRRACLLAEQSQGPVFVLTDQFLADAHRAIEPFATEALPELRPGSGVPEGAHPAGSFTAAPPSAPPAETAPGDYRRHAFSGTGVSPRRLPGGGPELVVTDSDEHTEAGHLTEDLTVRRQMVAKRLRKERGLRERIVPPERYGDARPELLLVGWGSTRGAILEATDRLRAAGRPTGALLFAQVWPLEPESFADALSAAAAVIAIEGNATGQLARLIRRETGCEIVRRLQRFDGLPITRDYILRALGAEQARSGATKEKP
ncbi:MAG: 2-oxoacid:acceptor oxidoreductase subunit alpha [Candidatus Eisenbacteria bacterium]|nr:2-oxoacid:acceptor oxidoreductase subunit alpha [Candidatus Eisenbacteria bacterium]